VATVELPTPGSRHTILNSAPQKLYLTPKCRTYDRGMRLSFPLTLNFATLYVGKTESLHFQQMKDHNILEPTTGVIFFNSGFKSDHTELFPSIVLVIVGERRFPPPNFNLKIMRIQRGNGSWMLLDALLHYWEGSTGLHLKNVMIVFIMSCKIFMNFVKLLKLLWIFEVIVKKIHINYKVYSQTSIILLYG
jgi:hypothetical protein